MFWKMANVCLQKGSDYALYGGSAPFFKQICHKHTQI